MATPPNPPFASPIRFPSIPTDTRCRSLLGKKKSRPERRTQRNPEVPRKHGRQHELSSGILEGREGGTVCAVHRGSR